MNPLSRRALLAMSPLALASPAPQENEIDFDAAYQSLDEFIPRYMREWCTPGLALAITNRQKLLHVRAYGFSDAAARVLRQPSQWPLKYRHRPDFRRAYPRSP